jgi:hypothetical protein
MMFSAWSAISLVLLLLATGALFAYTFHSLILAYILE